MLYAINIYYGVIKCIKSATPFFCMKEDKTKHTRMYKNYNQFIDCTKVFSLG